MKYFFLLIFFLLANAAKTQHGVSLADPSDSTKVNYKIIPVAWYIPETGFTMGLTGISTFRLAGENLQSRPSSILFDAAVTLRGKVFAYIPFEIYKGNDTYRLKGEVGMYKYQYSYYGIGSNSRIDDKEVYNVVFPRIAVNLSKRISGPVFGGVGYRFDYFNITRIEEQGLLEQYRPTGTEGGIVSAGFLTFLLDSRDHIFDTHKGMYIEIFLEKSLTGLAATYHYQKLEVDARSFHPLGKDLVLANNIYYAQMSEDVPFFVMPYLSTSRRGRGYADRRFIDRTLLNIQSELRFPMFWRIEGAVMLSSGILAPAPAKLSVHEIKWAFGTGFRYIVDKNERNKIRLDLGFTNEDFNFYITANEAF